MTLALSSAPSLLRLSPNASQPERALLEELASRLRARDDVLVDRVLRELVPEVRRWMLRQLGPRPDLDDAVQDSLSAIAAALHRFEGRSSLATLAHRITLRTSYRYYRRRRPLELVEPDVVSSDDPEARVRARRALARLHDALGALPERRRAAFVLCAVEGLDPSEAAEVLGVTGNAMRSLLCRARQQLEALLEGDDELGGRAS
ncbi:MAG: RNA polymerase sigma factor [Myxococcales bacterium]|nr:RNA polymerase sigma factor [Myxococcales bacterium]